MQVSDLERPEYNYTQLIQAIEQQFSMIRGGLVDQSAFYLDSYGASEWYKLCRQADYLSNYRPPTDWPDRVTSIILPYLKNSRFDKNKIDIVGLGVGDGYKETALCGALLRAKLFEKLRCFLLDISPTLAIKAHAHFDEAIGKKQNVESQWILGNIHTLPLHTSLFYDPQDENVLRVGTLFDVFGNIRHERTFVEQSLRAFKPGDLFVIEVLLGFAPLDKPELIKAEDPSLKSIYGLEWIEGVIRRHRPQTKHVDFEFLLKYGASTFPKTYTIEIVAQMDDGSTFSIFQKHRYSADEFIQTFNELGWKPIDGMLYGPNKRQLLYVFSKR